MSHQPNEVHMAHSSPMSQVPFMVVCEDCTQGETQYVGPFMTFEQASQYAMEAIEERAASDALGWSGDGGEVWTHTLGDEDDVCHRYTVESLVTPD